MSRGSQNGTDPWEIKKSPLNGGHDAKLLLGPLAWFPQAQAGPEKQVQRKERKGWFAGPSGTVIHTGPSCLGQHSARALSDSQAEADSEWAKAA